LWSPYSEALLEPAIRRLAEARDYPLSAGDFPAGGARAGNAAGGAAVGDNATAGTTTAGVAMAGDAAAALQLVLWVLGDTGSYREGLLRIVNLGGDSDVNGALFGQLAGALYGAEGIPAAWRSGLLRRDLLDDLADRLLAAALAPTD
jgi:ADP-ribosylglycohydrolase